ncbi:hypothetical protein [Bradyrhizobium sp. Ec3.3]|uniref:hypothetical protein n=1 Tax=Bradyrhizobium sp. Ec3.3 TaxID=189753 RepID=UPI0003FC6895|nr:hypothetical protein [Bradyrhizobium sp. Ec3.3]
MLGSVRSTIRSTLLQVGHSYDRISYRPVAGSLRTKVRGWLHAVQRGPSKYRLRFIAEPKSERQEKVTAARNIRAATESNIKRLISAPARAL